MKIEKRIRRTAAKKTIIIITRRTRSRRGFLVIRPDGLPIHYPNKKTALAAMLAQLRVAFPALWQIKPA